MPRTALLALSLIGSLLTACVTETVEDEPKVYGRITSPNQKKAKKPKPVKHEETITEFESPQ